MKNSEKHVPLSVAAISGGFEAFLTHPLMTLKSRAQEGKPIQLMHFIKKPSRTILQLYRGVIPNVLGMSAIVTLRFKINNSLLSQYKNPSIREKCFASSSAGAFSAIFTTPLELGVTLQQTKGFSSKSKTFFHQYFAAIHQHGPRHLLTGFIGTALRDSIVTSGFIFLAPTLINKLAKHMDSPDSISLTSGGVLAGIICTILSQPFDTLKTIQQANLRKNNKEGIKLLPVAKLTINKQGFQGLFKGLLWRSARVVPHIALVSATSLTLTQHVKQSPL